MTKEVAKRFDYSDVPPDIVDKLAKLSVKIRTSRDDIIDWIWAAHELLAGVGRDGMFRPWLEQECDFDRSYVYRLIQAREGQRRLGEVSTIVDVSSEVISPNALAAIGSPGASQKAIAAAAAAIERDGTLTEKQAKEIIARHKPKREPASPARETIEMEEPCPVCESNGWLEDHEAQVMKCGMCNHPYGEPRGDQEPAPVSGPRGSFPKAHHHYGALVRELSGVNYDQNGERTDGPHYAKCSKYLNALLTAMKAWEKAK